MSTAFLAGMFWKRTSSTAAFCGMVAGVTANIVHYCLYHYGIVSYRTEMAANFYIIIVGWLLGFTVTIGISLITSPRPEKDLVGLVYSLSRVHEDRPIRWFRTPTFWAIGLLVMLLFLAYGFW
jgi:SSS family solute:Na+ symporter